MRTISASLKNHLAENETTICTLVTITLRDATVLTYTDHDETVTFNGRDYSPLNSIVPTSLEVSNDLTPSSQDITGLLIDGIITISLVMANYLRDATVRTEVINYMSTSMGSCVLQVAKLGLIELKENTFKIELRDRATLLSQTVGELYQYPCRVELGSTKCGVNLANFTDNGTVTSVPGINTFVDSTFSAVDHWYTYGWVRWLTGDNAGVISGVAKYKSKTVTLAGVLPVSIQVGDTFEICAGCDKRASTCVTKFNNIERYRGFPFMPGISNYKLTQNNRSWSPTYDV